jgi:2-methylcitrate dehydratase
MLRSLDLMDFYVSADVSHPSEVIPTALACAEAVGASGRDFLEAVAAGIALHMHFADVMPLHSHGLHHAGHAAWVTPLVAGRLLAIGEEATTHALCILASQLILPEGFSRGQIANVKALAYPLIASRGIETAAMAADGLTGNPGACEEVLDILLQGLGISVAPDDVLPTGMPTDISAVSLKSYPAQYALQPLIAAASRQWTADPLTVTRLRRVVASVSRRTAERAADPTKYAPTCSEAADHSLPFCVALALLEGELAPSALVQGRWRDADVLALMQKIVAEPIDATRGFGIGAQGLRLELIDGAEFNLDCTYPPPGQSWHAIADAKIRRFSSPRLDADRLLQAVDTLESAPNLGAVLAALAG